MESVKKDFPKAANLFRSNCDDYNFPKSCYKYAAYSMVGRGCSQDQKRALDYFKKGCSLNDKDSCLYAGLMMVSNNKEGVTIERNYPSGMEHLRKACDVSCNVD